MVSGNHKYSKTARFGRVWLGKRADSGVWYLKYRIPKTGKPLERSAGTTSEKEAFREAEIISSQLTNQKIGVADGTIPLTRLQEKYLDAKNGRIKVKSFKRVQTSIVTFMEWLANTHPEVKLTRHLAPETVREFQKQREASGVSRRTVNNDIVNLHGMFRWGIRENLVVSSPADYSKKTGSIDQYRLSRNDADVYSEEEYHALVAEAERQGLHLIRDMIVTFAGTGMRYEELAHLWRKHIHWNTAIPTIEVRAHGGWTPKDPAEVKFIPMLPEVQEVVRRRWEACKNDDDLLFKNSVGHAVRGNKPRKRLQSLFPAVGIDEHRRLFWHSFRNYFVIRCLKKGVAVPALMKWTGHDSASMVLHYAEVIGADDVFAEFRKVS